MNTRTATRTAGSTAHRAKRTIPRGRYGSLTAAARPASRTGPPTVAGRWSLLPPREADPTVRAHALARTLLDRHGVVTRGAVSAEGVEGGFSATYRILSAFEDSGQARRGYVVEGLGAAQFAMDGAVDRLRNTPTPNVMGTGATGTGVIGLASTDPANPYGAALPWPALERADGSETRLARSAGSYVFLVEGTLAGYLERGGKRLTILETMPELQGQIAREMAAIAHRHRRLRAGADVLHRRHDGRACVGADADPRVARRTAAAEPHLRREADAALDGRGRASAYLVASLPVRLRAAIAVLEVLGRERGAVVRARVVAAPQLERRHDSGAGFLRAEPVEARTWQRGSPFDRLRANGESSQSRFSEAG